MKELTLSASAVGISNCMSFKTYRLSNTASHNAPISGHVMDE